MDPSFSQTPGKSFISIFCFLKNFKFGVLYSFNPLIANPIKWPNTLKQFVGNLPTNCLSVFGHFVNLALKGLMLLFVKPYIHKSYIHKLFVLFTSKLILKQIQELFTTVLKAVTLTKKRDDINTPIWDTMLTITTFQYSYRPVPC